MKLCLHCFMKQQHLLLLLLPAYKGMLTGYEACLEDSHGLLPLLMRHTVAL